MDDWGDGLVPTMPSYEAYVADVELRALIATLIGPAQGTNLIQELINIANNTAAIMRSLEGSITVEGEVSIAGEVTVVGGPVDVVIT